MPQEKKRWILKAFYKEPLLPGSPPFREFEFDSEEEAKHEALIRAVEKFFIYER